MNLQYFIISLALILYNSTLAQEMENKPIAKKTYRVTDRIAKCSFFLSGTLDKLCNNDYKILKKRDTSLIMQKLMPKELQEQLMKHKLMSTKSWRRVRRQIADECCNQPCTVGELILYCPSEAKLFQEEPDLLTDP